MAAIRERLEGYEPARLTYKGKTVYRKNGRYYYDDRGRMVSVSVDEVAGNLSRNFTIAAVAKDIAELEKVAEGLYEEGVMSVDPRLMTSDSFMQVMEREEKTFPVVLVQTDRRKFITLDREIFSKVEEGSAFLRNIFYEDWITENAGKIKDLLGRSAQ